MPMARGLREPQVMRIGGLSAADQAGLRGDELQMRLVTQPLRLGDGELALVDRRREWIGYGRSQRRSRALLDLSPLAAEMLGQLVLPPAVVTRWPRNRGGVVRMEADTGVSWSAGTDGEGRGFCGTVALPPR